MKKTKLLKKQKKNYKNKTKKIFRNKQENKNSFNKENEFFL